MGGDNVSYRHCVCCTYYQRTVKIKTKCIGFCKRYGIDIKDTLSGCINEEGTVVIINNKGDVSYEK